MDGETGVQEVTELAGGHRHGPGRQRPDPPIYREGSRSGKGVGTVIKMLLQRAWQSMVLDKIIARGGQSQGTAHTGSGGAQTRGVGGGAGWP